MTNHFAHREAKNAAIDAGVKHLKQSRYQSMRDTLSAASEGVRPWPEKLTPETVASWIMANVSYGCPRDAHEILEAFAFESNR